MSLLSLSAAGIEIKDNTDPTDNTTSPSANSQNHDPSNIGGDGQGGANDKPRLTEHEKKHNHIASEQKRRQAIREGFDGLADIVPGLTGQGRSEAIVLQGATSHLRRLLADRYRLVMTAKKLNIDTSQFEMDDTTMEIAGEESRSRR